MSVHPKCLRGIGSPQLVEPWEAALIKMHTIVFRSSLPQVGLDTRQQRKVDYSEGCVWHGSKETVGLIHGSDRVKHLPQSPKERSPSVKFLSLTWLESQRPPPGTRPKEVQTTSRASEVGAVPRSLAATRSQSPVYVDPRQTWLWNLQDPEPNENSEPLCSKMIKNFKTATARHHQAKHMALLQVAAYPCGPLRWRGEPLPACRWDRKQEDMVAWLKPHGDSSDVSGITGQATSRWTFK